MFLDEVCTDIFDLDPALAGATRYGGSYSDYLDAKRAERQRWEQRYAREQDTLGQLRYAVKVTAREINHHRPPRDNNGDAGPLGESSSLLMVADAAEPLGIDLQS